MADMHTPLPWAVDTDFESQSYIRDVTGKIVASTTWKYGPFDISGSANAALIVTAVNERSALLARASQDAETIKALEAQIDAAREFVKRHPALSLIDLAEFEAFLKLPAVYEKLERAALAGSAS